MGLTNFTSPNNDTAPPGAPGGQPMMLVQMPQSGNTGGQSDDDLNDLLVNYNERFATADPADFRDELIEQAMSVLIGYTKPNPLLVGPAGVGKTRIVEDIARRIATADASVPPMLAEHTVYELSLTALTAGAAMVGQFEARVQQVIDFACNPKNKVILFIDEIHQIVGHAAERSSTLSKLGQILKPALARGEMKLIAATTLNEARGFQDDPALARRFSRLIVDELTAAQTRTVLNTVAARLCQHYNHAITVTDEVLNDVVTYADQFSRADQHRPDTAITLLDRAMAERIMAQQRLVVQTQSLGLQLPQATSVPLTQHRLRSVAEQLARGLAAPHQVDETAMAHELNVSVLGQETVLEKVLERIQRHRLGLFPSTKPLSMLFAGPSGVGKTETAKILAQHLTGAPPITLNMSEYNHDSTTTRIVGSPAGYIGSESNTEKPFDCLESNPYRVILLDEFEKADRSVQQLFLSALDEGWIETAKGQRLDFSKAIVIATTNAGREVLAAAPVGFRAAPEVLSEAALAKALAQSFPAEILGRFGLLVGFNPINAEKFAQIVTAVYDRELARITSQTPQLASSLAPTLSPDRMDQLVTENYKQELGARPITALVRAEIENAVLACTTTTTATISSSATASDHNTDQLPTRD